MSLPSLRRRSRLAQLVEDAEKHQIGFYLGAIASAILFGLLAPHGAGETVEHAIEPVLAALLYATFLQVPFLRGAGVGSGYYPPACPRPG